MVSLRAIWVSCGKPNPEICADNARRKDAVTMAASALHMTVSCVGRSFTLGSLYKRMQEYTRHAWHEAEACYKAALQVCSDYEEGTRPRQRYFFDQAASPTPKKTLAWVVDRIQH